MTNENPNDSHKKSGSSPAVLLTLLSANNIEPDKLSLEKK